MSKIISIKIIALIAVIFIALISCRGSKEYIPEHISFKNYSILCIRNQEYMEYSSGHQFGITNRLDEAGKPIKCEE
jgi:hypothetical protein